MAMGSFYTWQQHADLNPNSEVGEHARHGRGGTRLASRTLHDAIQSAGLELFERPTVFREGAENSARDGRAPFSISESG
jgi:hypothetical protein